MGSRACCIGCVFCKNRWSYGHEEKGVYKPPSVYKFRHSFCPYSYHLRIVYKVGMASSAVTHCDRTKNVSCVRYQARIIKTGSRILSALKDSQNRDSYYQCNIYLGVTGHA